MNSNVIDLAAYRAERARTQKADVMPGYFLKQYRDGRIVSGINYPHGNVCLYSGDSLTEAARVMSEVLI